MNRAWGILFAVTLATACIDPDDTPRDMGLSDAGADDSGGPVDADADAGDAPDASEDAGLELDAGTPDLGGYAHVDPPQVAVPSSLASQTWLTHYVEDIEPYWTMTEAVGSPEGNFPTYRGMDGSIQNPSDRRPRMIARQTFAYAVGFMLTGEDRLLELAHAGAEWLIAHAKDTSNGGWHGLLNNNGNPTGSEPKYAQDASYAALGLAAYYFVTRDPAAEAEVLATRDMLFDPSTYWDADNQRIRDGMNPSMSAPIDQGDDGGWELVAQLDPVNAFMMLVQPVLTEAGRRDQFLDDIETLSHTMIDDFWQDGIFWGIHNKKGQYGTRHVDFGHTLKSYWMILQADKRLADHPFQSFLNQHAHDWVERAYDAPNGRWAKRPTDASNVEYGSDWWIYAEADQIAATLNLLDYRYSDELEQTAGHWLSDYVDTNAAKEIIPGINRLGGRVYNWPPSDTAKCNLWKSGFHSAEHALIFFLLGKNLEGQAAPLYFAVPSAQAQSFAARPYIFLGAESERSTVGSVTVGTSTLSKVRVSFVDLY